MARNHQDIQREISRIEGQLLVAKQICRENLREINQLKEQHKNDEILTETHRFLSKKTLTNEHVDRFNQLLEKIDEQRRIEESTRTFVLDNEQENEKKELLSKLASNVAQLESLFDYAETLCTKPISSINMLNNSVSLHEIGGDFPGSDRPAIDSFNVDQLQQRIDKMHDKLIHADRDDHCFIQ